MNPEKIIRCGFIQFQEKHLAFKSWKNRFLSVSRNGICTIHDTEQRNKERAAFHLEGGETVEAKSVKNKNFPFGFVVVDDKRDWLFACASDQERKKWMASIDSVLKQLGAINNLGEVLMNANIDTIEGQLEFAKTMASCGQSSKARRAYSKLIVDHGDHDRVHHAYECFLVRTVKEVEQAESNFVRRLRFLCVPKKFLRTKAGTKLRHISRRIAFFSLSDSHESKADDNTIDLNQYRLQTTYHGEIDNPEDKWPYWLYKVNAGELQNARDLINGWFKATNTEPQKFEYSYDEIELLVFRVMRECVEGQKGVKKLVYRLDEIRKRRDPTYVPATDADNEPSNHSNELNSPLEIKQSQTSQAEDEESDDYAIDKFIDDEELKFDDEESDEDPLGRTKSDSFGIDLDDILDEKPANNKNEPIFKRKGMLGGKTSRLTDVEVGGVVDELDLSFFHKVDRTLHDHRHILFPWTAIALIWIVRRDKMGHLGGAKKQELQIRCVLEFIYLFVRGCLQHLNKNLDYRLILACLFNLPFKTDPDDVHYKLYLQAVKVFGDPRVDYYDKSAVFDFVLSQRWNGKLHGASQKKSAELLVGKGLKAELRKHFLEMDKVYEKALYLNKLYPKVVEIDEEKYIKEPITRQDHEKVQGRCTWGPRKQNMYDRNAFALVCNHRGVKPLEMDLETEDFDEDLLHNFDVAYLLFCQSLAQKLRAIFVRQLKSLLRKFPGVTVEEAKPKGFPKHYSRVLGELTKFPSPKAARILDYCSIAIGFRDLRDLYAGFLLMDRTFRICRIANQMPDTVFVRNNVRNLYLYVLGQHPENRFVKLICEVKLTLRSITDIEGRRVALRDKYEQLLGRDITFGIQKEVFSDLGANKKEQAKQLMDHKG